MADDALSVIDRGAGSAVQVMQSRMGTITAVMANVLVEGQDYGKIPGTDKLTLFKAGAEKLMLTFRLAAAAPTIEDFMNSDEVRYRVQVPIENADGRVLAVGVGEASSNEEKYRWRKPVCDEEFEETPEHLRRMKWYKGKEKPYQQKQIRTSPADVANTILKMAHKRGFIHGTLLATGASSVFNQGVDEFQRTIRDAADETPRPQVQRASATGKIPVAKATLGNFAQGKVKDVRAFGKEKSNWALLLDSGPTEYTTKDVKLANELEGFKGTDHVIRVRYEDNEYQGTVYHNLKSFAIVDGVDAAAMPKSPVPPAATAAPGDLTAGDIPFGR